jgi:pimeloyl-ACP methyl ester carboxylesterase
VTFDGRGNGRSDRPRDVAAYADTEFVADALAVMDETATEREVLVGTSKGGGFALRLAAEHPERVLGAVFVDPAVGLADPIPARIEYPFDEEIGSNEGWAKYNQHYWLKDWPGFAEFFMAEVFSDPHSTKPIEDGVAWGLETDAETMIATQDARGLTPEESRELCGRVRCPVLVIQGENDAITSFTRGAAMAEQLGAELVVLEGSGHAPHLRDPVKVNLLIREFLDSLS